MKNDLIHFVAEGQTISARNQNAIIRQVRSLHHGMGYYIDGTGVYARRLGAGRGTRFKPFELKESKAPSDFSVDAYGLVWNDSSKDWDTDEDDVFEVYDSMHRWRGYGADDTQTGEPGFFGWARYENRIGGYEIDHLQPWIEQIEALVNMAGGLDTEDENITIDNVQGIGPSGIPNVTILKPDLSGPLIEIPNTFGWNACNNALLVAKWHEADIAYPNGVYQPWQLKCC